MKKIDRRKAIKNLTIGLGGATLLSSPLSGFAHTETNSKTISSRELDIPQKIEDIIKPKTLKISIVRICILDDNHPAKGVKIAVATILPVTTQEI